MNWQSDEEKEFKTKYVENYSSTHVQLLNMINKRLEELESFFKNTKLSEDEYNRIKQFYATRKQWVNDVELEIQQISKEEDNSLKDIKDYLDPKKLKVKKELKDIRDAK